MFILIAVSNHVKFTSILLLVEDKVLNDDMKNNREDANRFL